MTGRTERIEFRGADGHMLAARLDRPDNRARAYVLFAHCFTCSKDVFAAARISQSLAQRGFGVLRFDFTGLGASEGDFANTNFSSNVADLVAAAGFLRDGYEAPQVLIGHSLGGAAVLAAAKDIPEAQAVATIGAPADAAHVTENFGAKRAEIEARGTAEVTLGGRSFTIKKQFLDDVEETQLLDRLGHLGKALLVFHAPGDETVGIENAGRIFGAARHPKSFVSLDDADHLLTRRADARYVADVVSAWASRFLVEEDVDSDAKPLAVPGPDGVVTVAETHTNPFQQQVVSGKHELVADEPESYGGGDTGPSPYDFLSIALGACTTMTLRMYGGRKKLPLDDVRVEVRHAKVHAKDCADCGEGASGRVDRFERVIHLRGDLTDERRQRLLEIADRCPVHQTLEKSSVVVTRLAE